MTEYIKAFHGGRASIMLKWGLKRTIDTWIGDGRIPYTELLVYLTDNFLEAAMYAGDIVDGAVIEVRVPKNWVFATERHEGTWYLIDHDVPPNMIIGCWDAGGHPWLIEGQIR